MNKVTERSDTLRLAAEHRGQHSRAGRAMDLQFGGPEFVQVQPSPLAGLFSAVVSLNPGPRL